MVFSLEIIMSPPRTRRADSIPVFDNSPSGDAGHSSDHEIGIERDRPTCSMFDNEKVGRSCDTAHLLVVDR